MTGPGAVSGRGRRNLRGPWGGGPYYGPPAISGYYWI